VVELDLLLGGVDAGVEAELELVPLEAGLLSLPLPLAVLVVDGDSVCADFL
jgi:hypothetical protein